MVPLNGYRNSMIDVDECEVVGARRKFGCVKSGALKEEAGVIVAVMEDVNVCKH